MTEETGEIAENAENALLSDLRVLGGFFLFVYSYRSAWVGAILDARRAGT